MTFEADRVRTLTIDSYSTVVDFRAAARALDGRVEDPEAVAAVWRERSLTYGSMSNSLGGYEPFREMLDHALEYALAVHDEDLSSDVREEVLNGYDSLPEFDDVRPGLERLTEAGYDVYVLSNGSPGMLSSMVANAGIADLIADEISVDEVGKYKVHPEVYRHAAARTGTSVREIAHASAGWFDAVGAMNVGMQGVWMNRSDAPPETWGPAPDLTVASFTDLADALE